MDKLEQHQLILLSRSKAWNEYNRSKLELDEMREIYNHTFIRDKYVEKMIDDLEKEIQVWDFIFTMIEKSIPHDRDTTYHG